MRLVALFCVLLTAACSSCAGVSTRPVEYASVAAAIRDRSSVRIIAECADGRTKLGSGVAVSSRHILTADHVTWCDEAEAFGYTVVLFDGSTATMILDRRAGSGVDTALLVAAGFEHPFRTWASVGAAPRKDDQLCYTAGDGHLAVRTTHCGPYTSFTAGGEVLDVVAVHGAPGNSGAGIFNEFGELVGILYAGAFRPGYDYWIAYEAARKWRHLIP